MIVACGGEGSIESSSPPTQSTCNKVSNLQTYPYSDTLGVKGEGLARAWHIWFEAFAPVSSGTATVIDFMSGRPTKVIIHSDPAVNQAVELIGIDCSTRALLHFCYNDPHDCDLVGRSLTTNELSILGSDHVTIAASPSADYSGYMLFPRPGRYLLSVIVGNSVLGSVTLAVPGVVLDVCFAHPALAISVRKPLLD